MRTFLKEDFDPTVSQFPPIQFPEKELLIEKAERIISSCHEAQQVFIGKRFIHSILRRGHAAHVYSKEEIIRLAAVTDYLASRKIYQFLKIVND